MLPLHLPFNATGYRFGVALSMLREALLAAERGLRAKRSDIEKKLAKYEQSGEFIGEYEDDHKLWEQSDFYKADIEQINEALADVRKPYVIALFHTWERMALSYGKPRSGKPSYSDLKLALEAKGVRIHPELNAVRALNNALKHNSQEFGPKLLQMWPELLPMHARENPFRDPDDWYGKIKINDEHILRIIEILKESGPQTHPSEQPSQKQ